MKSIETIISYIQKTNSDCSFEYTVDENRVSIFNNLFVIRVEFTAESKAFLYRKWKSGLIGRLCYKGSFKKMNTIYSDIQNCLTGEGVDVSEVYISES